ncbi:MAG TPA: type II toxin-antitoxin system antitoxin SocA domain-containing protein [Longimicrobium sp.]|nr:type II toxin-antitoxin system antitoxin SocA domain-containing protein [Longimicrobium sp.]
MTSADAVADYLLALARRRGEPVGNLKLQRLLYYAQAWHLGRFGAPLFPEPVEAWLTGPVVPTVFHRFRPHGVHPLPPTRAVVDLPPETAAFLDGIARDYLEIDEYELDRMTCAEAPWQRARRATGEGDDVRPALSEAEMRAFFAPLAHAA